ncbi:hypothetical protein BCV72DRAFT_89196 [Rhizopus microsporus var. microsporus]|uniref:Uncharacterized protein n=1 Tax=Rhizopus microsporus var. microsporus TaxID=86635 RepID=A0A1X0R8Y0_RHIZD|nr:hypothetical protein BCV72DRAFT_89196 [Rhizopus microsporus var. microsporus]
MKDSLYQNLRERRCSGGNTALMNRYKRRLTNSAYSDNSVMSQLTIEKTLEGHAGCINTLDWSSSGEFLLSGSDDTRLNIYNAYNNFSLQCSIQSGHSANIFSAYFMPNTSDRIIISGAGDSEIKFDDWLSLRITPMNF